MSEQMPKHRTLDDEIAHLIKHGYVFQPIPLEQLLLWREHVQQLIKQAEERQRVKCAEAFSDEYGEHSGENEYYECMQAILNAIGDK